MRHLTLVPFLLSYPFLLLEPLLTKVPLLSFTPLLYPYLSILECPSTEYRVQSTEFELE